MRGAPLSRKSFWRFAAGKTKAAHAWCRRRRSTEPQLYAALRRVISITRCGCGLGVACGVSGLRFGFCGLTAGACDFGAGVAGAAGATGAGLLFVECALMVFSSMLSPTSWRIKLRCASITRLCSITRSARKGKTARSVIRINLPWTGGRSGTVTGCSASTCAPHFPADQTGYVPKKCRYESNQYKL